MESKKSQTLIISLLFLVSLHTTFFAYSISFDNTSFSITNFNTDIAKLRMEGDSSISAGDGILQLTINQRDKLSNFSTGWALYSQQLHLWDNETNNVADFTTSFSFSISSENRTPFADGMVFFLTEQQHMPTNSSGENLGILDRGNATAGNSSSFIAVEFDTFVNWYDANTGPHIGIDINSMNSVTTNPWAWNKIRQGGGVHALITYNASTMNLSALLTDDTSLNSSRVSAVVNLKDLLPERVNFGFSAATGDFYQLHRITSWNFSSSLEVATPAETNQTISTTPGGGNGSSNDNNTWIWFVASLSVFVLVGAAMVAAWFHVKKRSRRNLDEQGGEDDDLPMDEELEKIAGGPKKFTYKDLVQATDNFANERLLGEGGFGKVYEGYLATTGSRVAVKKITPESSQGFKEYAAEVKAVSQLRHRNLVQLSGWCHRKNELLLIYEYMSNRSLDAHLFKGRTLLPWETRYKIAQDLASALLYLHEEWEQCVIHRDIKASNIMLDSNFNAKLGDFGLARLTDHGKGSQTTVLAGTMGYMAPECHYTGKASKESDVYSFGVVLLEVVCGRKVIELRDEHGHVRLVDWVWELYGNGNLLDAVDPKLGGDMDWEQVELMMIVGLWCAHPDYLLRPSIREALSCLMFDLVPPTLPSNMPVPTYSVAPPKGLNIGNRMNNSYTSESSTATTTTVTSSSKASASSTSAALLSSIN